MSNMNHKYKTDSMVAYGQAWKVKYSHGEKSPMIKTPFM